MTDLPADHAALLAAVRASPDDFRRLVYADYLEEDGHANAAEFIRRSCQFPPLIDGLPGSRRRRSN